MFSAIRGAGRVWIFGDGLTADVCDERKTDSMMSSHALPAGDIDSETTGGMDAGFFVRMSLTMESRAVNGAIGHVYVNTRAANRRPNS